MKGKLFYKITDIRTLWKAWEKVKTKDTAAGIDNISISSFEKNLDCNLKSIRHQLENETYIPEPARRIAIPKQSSKEKRFIGIPSVKDKVAQHAFKIAVEPVFEKIFLKCVYGYRPGKGPHGAVRMVDRKRKEGYNWVLNLDIDNFFDTIDHKLLMSLFSEKIKEEPLVRLTKLWIKMGVIYNSEWLDPVQGVPQGNVLSPLLSNIYLHPFDREMTAKGFVYIRYADDFIVMCRTKEEAYDAYKFSSFLLKENLHLRLNAEENPIQNIREGFVFLGFLFRNSRKTISANKLNHIRERIKQSLRNPDLPDPGKVIARLNESITGWRQYYSLGNVDEQFQFLDNILFYNLSTYLRRNFPGSCSMASIRPVFNRVEFFLEKCAKEKQRLIELIIAHSRIQKERKPPLTVQEAVERKKKEYKTHLVKGTDLVAADAGSYIVKRGRWIVVEQKGKKILQMPLVRLRNVVVLSYGIHISSNIIKYCCDKRIPIHFLEPKGKAYAQIHYPVFSLEKSGEKPVDHSLYNRSFRLKAALLNGKIQNQIGLLQYYRSLDGIELEFKEQCDASISQMKRIAKTLSELADVEQIETKSRKIFTLDKTGDSLYWKAFKALLLRFAYFHGREKYGTADIVNSLLNFGYAFLDSKIYEEALLSGNNYSIVTLFKGKIVNHTPVTDLVLLFRQPVVDITISEMVRKSENVEMNRQYLSTGTRKKLTGDILSMLNSTITWKDRELSYLEIIRIQAGEIIAFIEKGIPFEPFIFPWPRAKV